MAISGRKAQVKVTGAAVAFTDDACTNTVTNLEYQITNSVKRIWDRTATITVKVGGSAVSATTYTLNRLTGTVIFSASLVRTVTVTGSYLPVSIAAEAKAYSYSLAATNLDASKFGDTMTVRQQGLKDATGSITAWKSADTFFRDSLTAGLPVVLEFWSDSTAAYDIRVWAVLNKDEIASAVDGLVEQSVEFEGTPDADFRVIST